MASINPTHGSGYGAAAAPARQTENFQKDPRNVFADDPRGAKQAGYGLPCAKCKTYYASDLTACPVCKSPQRVSSQAPLARVAPQEQLPNPEQLEEERERFCVSSTRRWLHRRCPPIHRLPLYTATGRKITPAPRSRPPSARAVSIACNSELTCSKRPCTWTLKKPRRLSMMPSGPTPLILARPTPTPRRLCSQN